MVYIGLLFAEKIYPILLPEVVQSLVAEDKKAVCSVPDSTGDGVIPNIQETTLLSLQIDLHCIESVF